MTIDTDSTAFGVNDRFARLPAQAALAVILAALLLIGLGFVGGARLPGVFHGKPGSDRELYLKIIDDVHRGQGYYPSAVREQRLGHYPLQPSMAVRPPTLATFLGALPTPFVRRLCNEILSLVTVAAWIWRLRGLALKRPISLALGVWFLAAAMFPAFVGGGYVFSEVWAGELISLSLALYSPRRWPVSLALGVLALSLRELSAPYLFAMAVLAWRDGRRGEAVAWLAGLAAFVGGMTLHAHALSAWVRPNDIRSQGWLGWGGWTFDLMIIKCNDLLNQQPDWVAATVTPLMLLGLIGRKGATEDRLALVVCGYLAAFLVVGRPDNSYWGLMLSPLWAPGLVSTIPALRTLAGRLRGLFAPSEGGRLSGAG